MSNIAIAVENLSKRYNIGARQYRHDTLRDVLVAKFKRSSIPTTERSNGTSDDTIWALNDISFEVKHGEVLGIIGRNGAGKTTLLKILSRITEPTSGRAVLNGRVGSLLEVGTGFHPELTGRENIFLNGAILGMTHREIERKFDEIVDFSEIEKFLNTPIKHYSSGMYVRLAFAVAAHLEPEILLVDEVLAVGDAQFQKKCLRKMGGVAKEGRTVLFVSHNLIALRSLCPRTIWLDDGALQGEGPSTDVITDYLQLQSKMVSEQVWDDLESAPGNETAKIHRVWVESEKVLRDVGYPRESEISVGVEYWHLDPSSQIHITLHFKTEQQVVAFTTGSSHNPSWHELSRRTGLLHSVWKIPAKFLNTGQYNVTVLIVKNTSRVVYTMEDALSFEVIATMGRTGSWYGREPGVVTPQLQWEIQHLGDGLNQIPKSESL